MALKRTTKVLNRHFIEELPTPASASQRWLLGKLGGHELSATAGNQAEAGEAPQSESLAKGCLGGLLGLRSLLMCFRDSHQSRTTYFLWEVMVVNLVLRL